VSSAFCIKLKEAWMETSNLYLVTEYCKFGDLLDYLEKLEKCNYEFPEAFYWDIIFEMIHVKINI
jgi:hypothetical protein